MMQLALTACMSPCTTQLIYMGTLTNSGRIYLEQFTQVRELMIKRFHLKTIYQQLGVAPNRSAVQEGGHLDPVEVRCN